MRRSMFVLKFDTFTKFFRFWNLSLNVKIGLLKQFYNLRLKVAFSQTYQILVDLNVKFHSRLKGFTDWKHWNAPFIYQYVFYSVICFEFFWGSWIKDSIIQQPLLRRHFFTCNFWIVDLIHIRNLFENYSILNPTSLVGDCGMWNIWLWWDFFWKLWK